MSDSIFGETVNRRVTPLQKPHVMGLGSLNQGACVHGSGANAMLLRDQRNGAQGAACLPCAFVCSKRKRHAGALGL